MLTREEMLRIIEKNSYNYNYKEKVIVQAPAFYKQWEDGTPTVAYIHKCCLGDYGDFAPHLYVEQEKELTHEEQMDILEIEHSAIVERLEAVFRNS